jgi:hypothetical protein
MDKANPFKLGRGVKLRPAEIALVLFLGLVVGLFLGYILMGTAHAMFDIGELLTKILHNTRPLQPHQGLPRVLDVPVQQLLLMLLCLLRLPLCACRSRGALQT